jgi:hypothetical protein
VDYAFLISPDHWVVQGSSQFFDCHLEYSLIVCITECVLVTLGSYTIMVNTKSLDEIELIATLLCDAQQRFGDVFNTRQLRNTIKLCSRRYRREGISFLTKTMPRLDKHLTQVLAGEQELDVRSCGFTTMRSSKLPKFLGELFSLVFHTDGTLLPNPNAECVRMIRDILCAFYKYKVPYRDVQEQQVVSDFKQTESDLRDLTPYLQKMKVGLSEYGILLQHWKESGISQIMRNRLDADPELALALYKARILHRARNLLAEVFNSFDPRDITPSHGPGVVSTKERLWDKFLWRNVSKRITDFYPFDAYFCASAGHVCDQYHGFNSVTDVDHPAQVILVPKDSRGPRLISCEPVDFQWIQQGLSRAIVHRVETHWLTKHSVFFTDQVPNQIGALVGSKENRYSTLDLKEASDRVHLDLVRLLFPSPLLEALEACRSTSTRLPDGEVLQLQKYAPMGSALCFPVMALTIWSLLTAVTMDANVDFRAICTLLSNRTGLELRSYKAWELDDVHVYGDDVIVPTAVAGSAMTILEFFGLKINRNKSCTKGLFKESCGVDAFKGINVTPVRLRTVWNESPRPDVYTSWIAYANSYWDRRYYTTYEYIVSRLVAIYGPIPDASMCLTCPSLRVAPAEHGSFRTRTNYFLQKKQYWVRDVTSPSVNHDIDGWSMLLRYFTEAQRPTPDISDRHSGSASSFLEAAFSVSRYTKRHSSKLVWRWR